MTHATLERLGFEPGDRLVIPHADDIGMCHAANAAFWEDEAFGIITCGSVMVPCSWVPEMAAQCREHPRADVGVHLTLTSEWHGHRWRPVSTLDPSSGLIDDDGYMWNTIADVHSHMDPDAAIAEMRAQIEVALSLGIDVTHIDTHMGAVVHPLLFPAYVQLAVEYGVPALLPRLSEEQIAREGIDPQTGQAFLSMLDKLAATGFPVLDHTCAMWEEGVSLDLYCRLFDSMLPGITHLRTHPSVPGFDIEAITDSAPHRIDDYWAFLQPELKAHISKQGIHLIGYRCLRDLIRETV